VLDLEGNHLHNNIYHLQDDPAQLYQWLPDNAWGKISDTSAAEGTLASSKGAPHHRDSRKTVVYLTIAKWELKSSDAIEKKSDINEDDERPNRLYRIKGLDHPYVRQVPVTPASLNEGDSFVLDAGTTLYAWLGMIGYLYFTFCHLFVFLFFPFFFFFFIHFLSFPFFLSFSQFFSFSFTFHHTLHQSIIHTQSPLIVFSLSHLPSTHINPPISPHLPSLHTGTQSNENERAKALHFMTQIAEEELGGAAKMCILESDECGELMQMFWCDMKGKGEVSVCFCVCFCV
jgi:hypothetical protein